jgi:hypothetical protein
MNCEPDVVIKMCDNFFMADKELKAEISLLLEITKSTIKDNQDSDEDQESINDENF